MKNRKSLIIALAILLWLLAWWHWWPVFIHSTPQGVKEAPVMKTNASPRQSIATAPLSAMSPSIGEPIGRNSATNQQEVKMNPALPDSTKLQMILDAQNGQSLKLYGKVIDQNGQPVSEAKIRGNILVYASIEASGSKDYFTETDATGKFQFDGLHGAQFFVLPQKDGYQFVSAGSVNWSKDYIPNPNNPMIFTMYKLQGAEPMVHAKFGGWIPVDGTSTTINIFTGKISATGDLKVTLIRDPLHVKRGRDHFDWTVQIGIIDGGLVEEQDPYPYEASESDYQPLFEFSQVADAPNWTQKMIKDFYVRTSNGEYGRIHVDLTTDSDRPDGTGLSVEAYMNPAPGSRDLEFDEKKAVKGR